MLSCIGKRLARVLRPLRSLAECLNVFITFVAGPEFEIAIGSDACPLMKRRQANVKFILLSCHNQNTPEVLL
jgi:hypothetical protein